MFEISHNKIREAGDSMTLKQSFRIGLLLSPLFTEGEIKNQMSEKPAQYLKTGRSRIHAILQTTFPSMNWNAGPTARQPSSVPILNRTGKDRCSRLGMRAPQQDNVCLSRGLEEHLSSSRSVLTPENTGNHSTGFMKPLYAVGCFTRQRGIN